MARGSLRRVTLITSLEGRSGGVYQSFAFPVVLAQVLSFLVILLPLFFLLGRVKGYHAGGWLVYITLSALYQTYTNYFTSAERNCRSA